MTPPRFFADPMPGVDPAEACVGCGDLVAGLTAMEGIPCCSPSCREIAKAAINGKRIALELDVIDLTAVVGGKFKISVME